MPQCASYNTPPGVHVSVSSQNRYPRTRPTAVYGDKGAIGIVRPYLYERHQSPSGRNKIIFATYAVQISFRDLLDVSIARSGSSWLGERRTSSGVATNPTGRFFALLAKFSFCCSLDWPILSHNSVITMPGTTPFTLAVCNPIKMQPVLRTVHSDLLLGQLIGKTLRHGEETSIQGAADRCSDTWLHRASSGG